MNKSFVPLSSLAPSESGIVKHFSKSTSLSRRLFDIGLIRGTRVLCAFKSPSEEIAAYLIRGALIALRKEDTDYVFVEV